jgi:hypothetical protein
MKLILFLILNHAFQLNSFASDHILDGHSLLNEPESVKESVDDFKTIENHSPKEMPSVNETTAQNTKKSRAKIEVKTKAALSQSVRSNLPQYYLAVNSKKSKDTESSIILPMDSVKETLKTLRPGDILSAQVEHSVIAFPDEKAPVVARITSGHLTQSRLVGFSRLEPNSNRVFIDFEMLSPKSKAQAFSFKGTALTELGTPGFEGIHHSKEAKYFAGDFISTFMAAYFDAQVPKYLTPFGGTIEDTSINSSTKKALSQSAMSSAERFREKLKKFPEFSELKGPFEIKVLVLAPAIEN